MAMWATGSGSRRRLVTALCAVLALLLSGCSGGASDPTEADSDRDATTDAVTDVATDVVSDPDLDAEPDVPPDADAADLADHGDLGDDAADGLLDLGPDVTLAGAVEKGPFVLGSSVAVSPIDALGNPTGQVFNTQTVNDLGEFAVAIGEAAVSAVSLEGNGFYYNEVTGQLSTSDITLRAFYELTGGDGVERVYLNAITHMGFLRIRWLLDGADFDLAIGQAEGELHAALGLTAYSPDDSVRGTDLTTLGGDVDANAYLFAVGAVLGQAAVNRVGVGGPVDATLQEIVNTIAQDLEEDGLIAASLTEELRQAQANLDPDQVMQWFAERLDDLGSDAEVPDLHRVVDSDLDDLANAFDNCPLDANLDQADSDGDGLGDACDCGNGKVDGLEECDDGNDIDDDACTNGCVETFCGDGVRNRDEACDDENDDNTDDCLDTCADADCGDGFVHDGVEDCDDENDDNTDDCLDTCASAECGDGFVHDSVEDCDDGDEVDDNECANDCTFVCGNGIEQGDEACDDGNDVDGDGCEADCTLPACDNAIYDPYEVCLGDAAIVGAEAAIAEVAVGDVDGDDVNEVVVVYSGRDELGLFENGGAGALEAPVALATGGQPSELHVVDLDGDGIDDVVALVKDSEAAVVFLGAEGGLGSAETVPLGQGVRRLGVGQWAGDSAVDLLALSPTERTLWVALGDGEGGFGQAEEVPTDGQLPNELAPSALMLVADIDGNGVADVIVTSMEGHAALLGDGEGGIANLTYVPSPPEIDAMTAADVDLDGRSDVTMVSQAGEGLVSLSRPGPSFELAWLPSGSSSGNAVTVDDLDQDGLLDLAIGGADGLMLLVGDGTGGFSEVHRDVLGGAPFPIAALGSGDLDGNCNPDVVLAYSGETSIEVRRLNAADGSACGVIQRLAILTGALPAATRTVEYGATLRATGGVAPYTWSATGLPTGLSIGDGGVIDGAPTDFGSFVVAVTATDDRGVEALRSYALSVAESPVAITTSLPDGELDQGYAVELEATGGVGPYRWSVNGLPSGLYVDAFDETSSWINGTPTRPGVFRVTLQVTDDEGREAVAVDTVEITSDHLVLLTTMIPPAAVGVPYQFQLEAGYGQPPYRWSSTDPPDMWPAGLSLATDGTISGTCTEPTAMFTQIQVVDDGGASESADFILECRGEGGGPVITTDTLPPALVGQPYLVGLEVVNGSPPYQWVLPNADTLWPPEAGDLAFSVDGVITGTCAAPFEVTLRPEVVDQSGVWAAREFTFRCVEALGVRAELTIGVRQRPAQFDNLRAWISVGGPVVRTAEGLTVRAELSIGSFVSEAGGEL